MVDADYFNVNSGMSDSRYFPNPVTFAFSKNEGSTVVVQLPLQGEIGIDLLNNVCCIQVSNVGIC